ncbi:hypothetical protein V6N13_097196 [Hibiscus sabdariffa]
MSASRLWKNICRLWNQVESHVVWQVSDDLHIDFWRDSWLGGLDPLISFRRHCVVVPDTFISVASMVGINGDWRWDILEQLLPTSALLHIATVKAPSLSCLVDVPGWGLMQIVLSQFEQLILFVLVRLILSMTLCGKE